ncbi:MAG TPA: hypothetical protein VGM78_11490, partial [Ilumatobacteraceae bacterium]
MMLLAGILTTAVTLAVGAGVASAHHVVPNANVVCNGTVAWTATAWSASTSAERTNGDIAVWYTTDASSTPVYLKPTNASDDSSAHYTAP